MLPTASLFAPNAPHSLHSGPSYQASGRMGISISVARRVQQALIRRCCSSGTVVWPRMLLLCQRRSPAASVLAGRRGAFDLSTGERGAFGRRRVGRRLCARRDRPNLGSRPSRHNGEFPPLTLSPPLGPGALRNRPLHARRRILPGCRQPRQPRSATLRGSSGRNVWL